MQKNTVLTEKRAILNMSLSAAHEVSVVHLQTCLLVLFALLAGAETLQTLEAYMKPLMHKRLDVTPRDVIAHSSVIDCEATCRMTSWCFAANLLPDKQTCQLLTEEVPDDDESLDLVDGWRYIREYAKLRYASFLQ